MRKWLATVGGGRQRVAALREKRQTVELESTTHGRTFFRGKHGTRKGKLERENIEWRFLRAERSFSALSGERWRIFCFREYASASEFRDSEGDFYGDGK